MTNFIEKITDNRRWTNDALENTVVLLNIDCPICGKHEVYVRSTIFNNPVIVGGDMRRCSVVVGCVPCGELMVWCANPDLTMDEYKDLINKALVYDWLDAVDRDSNVHAWRRDKLFDIANGIKPPEFWQHAYEARMRAGTGRLKWREKNEEESDI